jgi:hypothetical protein
MGIFGADMPMLYGEGDKALFRLREEIMKTSDFQTIFAWKQTSGGRSVEAFLQIALQLSENLEI